MNFTIQISIHYLHFNFLNFFVSLQDWRVNQQPASPAGVVQQQLFCGEFNQLRSRKPPHEEEGG